MSGKAFVDTNILVYLFDAHYPEKQARATQLVTDLVKADQLVLSTQVLQELYVTLTRKLGDYVSPAQAYLVIQELSEYPVVAFDSPLVLRAALLSRQHQLSLWDSLIVEAAAHAGCERLITEDLQSGQEIRGVRIEDPFQTSSR